ncbi:MAG: O-methyltransferase [Flavobacteriales bacterium]
MLSELLDEYLDQHVTDIPDYLLELEDETHRSILRPVMLSGRVQGRLLAFISKLSRPKAILEIGTYTGYSALCMAEGLAKDGQITTLEVNDELSTIQNKYFQKSEYEKNIKVIYGDAAESIKKFTTEKFDIIFIDANKKSYSEYLELTVPLLNEGGLLLADNVLWYNKVLDPNITDTETTALRTFNQEVTDHPKLKSFILPFRDGLTIAQKKEA